MAKKATSAPRTNNRRSRRIARHVRLAAAHERALAHDLIKLLNRIARAAATHVAAGRSDRAADVVAGYESAMLRAFRTRLHVAAKASAELVIEELTGEKAAGALETKFISLLEIAERAVADWIAAYAAAKVRRILETTRKIIRQAIVRGNELNEPPRVLAHRIRDETGGEIGRARAQMIARTETHIASQVGSNAAADATGLQLDKEWGATEDARTRLAHSIADGQKVDKNAYFIVGGEHMRFPGDPNGSARNVINCRCVVLWRPRIPK